MINIQKYLQKTPFTIREPREFKKVTRIAKSNDVGTIQMTADDGKKRIIPQSVFLDQLSTTAHEIFCVATRGGREKWKKNTTTKQLEFVGYEVYHQSSLSFQHFIRRNKASIVFGNDPKFYQEFKGDVDDELLSVVKSHWNRCGLTYCLREIGSSVFGTGDAAIVEYIQDGQIRTEVFSFEKGDVINEVYNPFTREKIGVRMFYYLGFQFVELWFEDRVERWIYDGDQVEPGESRPYIQLGFKSLERSEDDYVLVYREPHGLDENPFTYLRRTGPVWQPAQGAIEDVEGLLSDIMESGKLFFHPILFSDSAFVSLPHIDEHHKTLAAKMQGTKMQFLQPPDISSAFEFAYNKLVKDIMDSTNSVLLHPDELKGQNDSSGYLALLYWPETQYAEEVYSELFEPLNKIFRIHRKCVGLVEGRSLDFNAFDFTWELTPKIPQNEYTFAQTTQLLVKEGIKSIRSAVEETSSNSPFELQRLKQEREEKIAQEAALSQATQPGTTELVVGESLQE